MKQRIRFSLGKKLALLIVLLSVTLSAAALFASYQLFSSTMTAYYERLGGNLVATLACQLDADALDRYYETGTTDENYYITQTFIRDLVECNNVEYLYVVRPHGTGVTFLFDSDMETSDGGTYAEGGYCALGTYVELVGDFAASLDALLVGRAVSPIVQKDESFGWQMTAMTPVLHEDGTMAGYVMADISMNDIVETCQSFLFTVSLLLAVLTLGFIGIFLVLVQRGVSSPINRLTQATEAFMQNHTEELSAGSSAVNVPVLHTGDELEQLAHAFRQMEEDVISYLRHFRQATAEKERIGAELDVATQIQADMLPRIFPAFPERAEFDIYASMTPAKEVGGDFYDFFLIDEDHLALVIADVSGKGVPAALFMVIAKTLLKNIAQTGLSPKEVLEKANEQLCENNEAEMFVTVWLGIYEISTGHLTAANAGHEYPALRRRDGRFELVHDKHGFVLAAMEGSRYQEYALTLAPGDTLFVYTDGVAEATDENYKLYGTDRMLTALNAAPNAAPETLLHTLKADIDCFVGGAPQFDDITMLSLQRCETRGKPHTFTVAPSLANSGAVCDFLEQTLTACGAPAKELLQINVAADEIFSNIARYSGADEAVITCTVTAAYAELRFRDNGIPYDPTQHPLPELTGTAEEREVGGLGIFIVRQTMDSLDYARADGWNILTVKKQFQV